MKQVGPLKSSILLLAHAHQRCVFYLRAVFVGIYCHVLNSNKLVEIRKLPNAETF